SIRSTSASHHWLPGSSGRNSPVVSRPDAVSWRSTWSTTAVPNPNRPATSPVVNGPRARAYRASRSVRGSGTGARYASGTPGGSPPVRPTTPDVPRGRGIPVRTDRRAPAATQPCRRRRAPAADRSATAAAGRFRPAPPDPAAPADPLGPAVPPARRSPALARPLAARPVGRHLRRRTRPRTRTAANGRTVTAAVSPPPPAAACGWLGPASPPPVRAGRTRPADTPGPLPA